MILRAPLPSTRRPRPSSGRTKPILLPAFFLILLCASAFADGGAVLAQQVSGPYRVTLFGSPAPLRAGPAELSVFIQDAASGDVVLTPTVELQIATTAAAVGESWVPPCCSMKSETDTVAATRSAAHNKLLQSANIVIPASGPHDIRVRIDGTDALKTAVEVAAPLPPAATYWPYLALPPLAIGLFAINRRARRRQSKSFEE